MLKMLFTPVRVGKMELKNRIVMPAMHFLPAWDGALLPHHTDYFAERARGGAALIIVGGCTIDDLSGPANMISVKDDKYLPGLEALARAVKENGARIAAQLYQAGRYAHSALMGGKQAVSSSAVRSKFTGETPRALTLAEIGQVRGNFALAAARVKQAGFDAVEILASAGYLISQFLSPVVNRREDEYGGSFANRMRFGLEVAGEVRRAVGPDFPVIFRVAGNEFVEGGLENAEMAIFCRELEKAGADMINVTGGWHETRVPQITMALPRAGYVYLAAGIKRAVSIPVMACNRINDPLLADRILRDGLADLIGFARGLIADPELPAKAGAGRFEEINRCIACNQGCFDTLFAGQPVTCLVNPRAGAEAARRVAPAARPRKVVVVGGGPAGMEAARVAALRGHSVSLYEQEDELGGQLLLAGIPPGRGEFLTFARYLETQLRKLNVAVHRGIRAAADQILNQNPDAVVLATGARPAVPPIRGSEAPNVSQAWDILAGRADAGQEVVVIGGGAVGLETALFLAGKGTLDAETLRFLAFNQAERWETLRPLLCEGIKKVAVVEMLRKLGRDIGSSTRWTLLQDATRLGVKTYTRTEAKEITPAGVVAERDGKEIFIPGDTVVLAAGARSENGLYAELKDRLAEVYLIGDAKNPRKALEAVAEGFETGRKI